MHLVELEDEDAVRVNFIQWKNGLSCSIVAGSLWVPSATHAYAVAQKHGLEVHVKDGRQHYSEITNTCLLEGADVQYVLLEPRSTLRDHPNVHPITEKEPHARRKDSHPIVS